MQIKRSFYANKSMIWYGDYMKSVEYIKKRIASGDTYLSEMKCDIWSERNFIHQFNRMFKSKFPECNQLHLKNSDGNIIAEVIYDNNADFNYFATAQSIHDGTIYFVEETAREVVKKVLECQTYNTNVIKDTPPNFDKKYFDKQHFIYTVGDIALVEEFSRDFATKDKPWLWDRTTAMLPIKFEVVDNVVDKQL